MNSTPAIENVFKHVNNAPSNTFLTCFSYQPENSFSGLWPLALTGGHSGYGRPDEGKEAKKQKKPAPAQ